ncbi:DNA-binding response regulator [Actinoplanes philippinensis]|uniref:DNA-binding response regulator, OmpR family, contains REC and winged-helix (WHTH) domain n=1 Tax=Actinoplanes philippinensis TaxID=35752 RepID=A0A1I2HKM7_9ACTN|nr:response regulator transcription factor [Actinoplanes philippinensis]GIE74075.1 DNA-binding response regulator [Actinoplanes philippinensis]SFF30232.1 DNA-binding response regulator, OmpR family, contains REC and winged-helix (wHTH) domain [Actinoplanes philippinensis]
MNAKVLVAEDDPKQAELLRRYLEHEGHTVTVATDGRAALALVRRQPPDLLVLDVMMPGIDGFEVCRVLRRDSGLPVLMLTARGAEEDLLLGLDLGADDYLTKPYRPRELAARVRALLRRTGVPDPRAGRLRVDPARHEVWADGVEVICTPGEFLLLEMMAAEPGRVFTRDQLLRRLHGFGSDVTARTVDVHVLNLRRKIEADPSAPKRLLTVWGVGYKLADG